MSKASEARKAKLVPNSEPRWVRCYDNGGESLDRYTCVFTGRYTERTGGQHWYLGMSEHPFHPQGFGQHSDSRFPIDTRDKDGGWAYWPPAIGRKHWNAKGFGVRVAFATLPDDVKRCIMQTYNDLWNLE